jgi:hypothetical protein
LVQLAGAGMGMGGVGWPAIEGSSKVLNMLIRVLNMLKGASIGCLLQVPILNFWRGPDRTRSLAHAAYPARGAPGGHAAELMDSRSPPSRSLC